MIKIVYFPQWEIFHWNNKIVFEIIIFNQLNYWSFFCNFSLFLLVNISNLLFFQNDFYYGSKNLNWSAIFDQWWKLKFLQNKFKIILKNTSSIINIKWFAIHIIRNWLKFPTGYFSTKNNLSRNGMSALFLKVGYIRYAR